MPKKSGPIYRGPLAEPVDLYADGRALPRSEWERERERLDSLFSERLNLLLDHYGVPREGEERWRELCLRLAEAHVPGFMFAAKKGRKTKWPPAYDVVVRIAVDDFIAKHPQHSIVSAAKHIAKSPGLAKLIGKSRNPGELIRQAYFRADPAVAEKARRLREENPGAVIITDGKL